MTLFQGKYRTESTRLKSWDYSAAGYYFVTICTKDQRCSLGEVINGAMRLSQIGSIVAEEWKKTAEIRESIDLDEWVIMPNHVHGIICLLDTNADNNHIDHGNAFGPQRNNLASLVRGFKGASTRSTRNAGYDFAWQSRFYDEIIGAEKSLDAIRNYVRNNPLQWELDRYNPVNYGSDSL